MGIGVVVILLGWVMTIRGLRVEVPTIQSTFLEGVDRAAEKIQEAQLDPTQEVSDVTDALEAFQDGYQAEKQQQETLSESASSYEQENITP